MKILFQMSNGKNRSQDFPKSPIRQQVGMALVITLSMVVLVTIATMAFFVRSMSNRAIESSRANRVEAEQLARTAADYVTGQFLQEIASNSINTTISGVTIYQPTTNTFAVPQRPLPSSAFSGSDFANLIRRSVNETTNGVGEANASTHNTATPSRNGRTVGPVRWNAPLLLSGSELTNTTQLPNWIYLNSDGSTTNSPGTKTIGRFAYNVYNIGGLLDANVAGFPSGVSGTNLAAIKGTLAGADLSVIPGITDANAFVSWRNAANAGSASHYVAAVTNAVTNGFLRVPPGDNRLANRQDLINLARNGSHGISTNALPYFTVFARSKNAPNWQPGTNATGASFQYQANAEAATSINRNLPNVRVTTAFTRRDGSPATVGEPLLKKRFPLSKISLLDGSGNAADIKSYFGLKVTAAGWTYDHGDSTRIKTLHEVAQAGREPDFFELLKAVILNGSLGRDPGAVPGDINAGDGPNGLGFDAYSSIPDMQILQIGANIIDQFDADSYPTAIYLDSIFDTSAVSTIMKTVYGIENLPYLYQINQIDYTTVPFTDYTAAGMSGYAAGWMQPVIWNPHVPREPSSTGVPQNFRVNTYGSSTFSIWVRVWDPNQNPTIRDSGPWRHSDPVTYNGTAPEGQITFPLATADSTYGGGPTPLTTGNSSTVPANQPPKGNSVGILSGVVDSVPAYDLITQTVNSANAATATNNPPGNFHFDPSHEARLWCHTGGNPDISFVLEYQDSNGVWRPYSHIARLAIFEFTGWDFSENNGVGYVHVDPRTDRFSVSTTLSYNPNNGQPNPWNPWSAGKTLASPLFSNGRFAFAVKTAPRSSSGFHYTPAYAPGYVPVVPLGKIFQNTTTPTSPYENPQSLGNSIQGKAYYTDRDGVVRPADGAEADLQTGYGCPIFPGELAGPNAARHPVVLNRPFRSVGELGYVFRDQPFCSLNFASPDSGDFGILDAFCVEDEPEFTAGRINPNTAAKVICCKNG